MGSVLKSCVLTVQCETRGVTRIVERRDGFERDVLALRHIPEVRGSDVSVAGCVAFGSCAASSSVLVASADEHIA